MNFKKIIKYSFIIGTGAFILMVIDFKFILNSYSFFGYLEFWGTIILISVSIYFFIKKNFVTNPNLTQYQLFYPALFISFFSGIIYGGLSWCYITFFIPDYHRIIFTEALKRIPETIDSEGTVIGIAFSYSAFFQIVFKFIGVSLFGLFYSLFIVNHFLWIQDFCNKLKDT